MPLYDFNCSEGHKFERMVRLADFEVLQHCTCGAPSTRAISLPMFRVENVGYDCPVTGKWIGSKQAHSENLKAQGCRVLETGEKEESQRVKARLDQDFERRLDETVERTIDSWDSAKKESLTNELLGGADLAVERK